MHHLTDSHLLLNYPHGALTNRAAWEEDACCDFSEGAISDLSDISRRFREINNKCRQKIMKKDRSRWTRPLLVCTNESGKPGTKCIGSTTAGGAVHGMKAGGSSFSPPWGVIVICGFIRQCPGRSKLKKQSPTNNPQRTDFSEQWKALGNLFFPPILS